MYDVKLKEKIKMKIYLFIIGLLFPVLLTAQSIKGKVSNNKDTPLIGANVYWIGSSVGTITNIDGEFEVSTKGITKKLLVASYVGHTADTIKVTNEKYIEFSLDEDASSETVKVYANKPGVIISDSEGARNEQLTQTELKKDACCDLAGSFGSQSSVQQQTTNVITNSKELQILGLSGIYNQVLIDGLPMIQGLSYTYGISSIPGTLIDNIFISIGANSVLQGYESITGQINVVTKDPRDTDKLYLNAYINNFMEKQLNANYAVKGDKWSNLTAFHTTQKADKVDRDKDNFLDVPQITRYSLFNKLQYSQYEALGFSTMLNLRFLNENRVGGQTNYNSETDKGSTSVYGQSVDITQPEYWSKSTYRFDEHSAITLFSSGYYQDQNSFFGTVNYDATQTNSYNNIQYEYDYDTHSLKAGLSYRYMELDENIDFTDTLLKRTYAGNYNKLEQIPGVFIENTLNLFEDDLTWIAGIRADNHNQFGTIVTPRTTLRYSLSENTTARVNIGTGWRTSNLFSENINLLASSRDVIFQEDLKPEKALNYGFNLIQKFNSDNSDITGHITADFYRTEFQNQIFPDYDTSPKQAFIQNFEGKSISNGFQLEGLVKLWEELELKSGYSYLDVTREVNGETQQLPFIPKHKVLFTVNYVPTDGNYQIDARLNWFGEKRLPNTKSNPVEYQRPDFSEQYVVANAQFTYFFDELEVYVGCENLLDFRQERPIISWENPFSPYFDTSSVWGPTRGREIYLGIRYTLGNE